MTKLSSIIYENLWAANDAAEINNHIELKGSVIYIYDANGNVKIIVKENRTNIILYNKDKILGYVNHTPKAINSLLKAIKEYIAA